MAVAPPYGYRRIKLKQEKGYSLEVHQEESEIVASIFDWYVNGRNGTEMGITAIAKTLHDMGIPQENTEKVWNQCRIYRMLTNEVYCGMIRWGYDKTVRALDDKGVQKKRR